MTSHYGSKVHRKRRLRGYGGRVLLAAGVQLQVLVKPLYGNKKNKAPRVFIKTTPNVSRAGLLDLDTHKGGGGEGREGEGGAKTRADRFKRGDF